MKKLKFHQPKWKRTDMGVARSLECSCGFVASGYTWEDVEKQKQAHTEEALT